MENDNHYKNRRFFASDEHRNTGYDNNRNRWQGSNYNPNQRANNDPGYNANRNYREGNQGNNMFGRPGRLGFGHQANFVNNNGPHVNNQPGQYNRPYHSDHFYVERSQNGPTGNNSQQDDFGQGDYDRSSRNYPSGNTGNAYSTQAFSNTPEEFRGDNLGSGNSYLNGSVFYGYQHKGMGREHRDWWDRTRDKVASWLGDDEASRRSNMDEQHTGRHRGKGPKGYQRSEDRIREDICDRLSADAMVDASDIQVEIQGNEVILSGNVHSKAEKRRAEDLVEAIAGVRHVENRLRYNRENDYDNRHWGDRR